MNTYRLKASCCMLGCILLAACQQSIPAPVVVTPAPIMAPAPVVTPAPVVAPAPKAQPKKVTPKPKKQIKEEEEDLVPVLPLRPHQVGNRSSILP
jgi:hypothetical protein